VRRDLPQPGRPVRLGADARPGAAALLPVPPRRAAVQPARHVRRRPRRQAGGHRWTEPLPEALFGEGADAQDDAMTRARATGVRFDGAGKLVAAVTAEPALGRRMSQGADVLPLPPRRARPAARRAVGAAREPQRLTVAGLPAARRRHDALGAARRGPARGLAPGAHGRAGGRSPRRRRSRPSRRSGACRRASAGGDGVHPARPGGGAGPEAHHGGRGVRGARRACRSRRPWRGRRRSPA
jgi:hypothetical protein